MALQNPDIFDFTEALRAARQDYPEETRHVTFIDLSAPDAEMRVRDWFKANPPELYARSPGRGKLLTLQMPPASLELVIKRKLEGSGSASWCLKTGKGLLAANGPEHVDSGMSQARDAQFSFDHELGHIISLNGMRHARDPEYVSDKDIRNEGEAAADCFAALRGFRRGTLTADEALGYSLRRALNTGTHLTCRALDEAIVNRDNIDYAVLSHQEIKTLAQQYAEDFTPTAADLKAMADHLKQDRFHEAWLENLADVCKKVPDDSFMFYISARVLAGILNSGKTVDFFEGEKTFDVTGLRWDKLRQNIAPRAKKVQAHLIRIR